MQYAIAQIPTENGANSTVWMDRNLGALQVTTTSTDTKGYGDLYQWGRNKDGHQLRNSTVIPGPVASENEGANFVTSNSNDWLNNPNDDLWNGLTKGKQDPCPLGFRVPTVTELQDELDDFETANLAGAFKSVLKLTAAGLRQKTFGAYSTNDGNYWSSTVSGTRAWCLKFTSSYAATGTFSRATGASVRCIKEE